jgi:carboxyl-terminal processing protease
MQNSVRWAVFGLLGASLLIFAFAIGFVLRGDGDGSGPSAGDGDGAAATDDIDFRSLDEILKVLDDNYVDPDRVDPQTLYEAAIDGMLNVLTDDGTYYIDPISVRTRRVDILSGAFEGIGATVAQQDGEIVIVAPIEDTPAERAGILPGDVVLEVDGQSTAGWTTEQAVLEIRGPRGTTVVLKVRHEDGVEEVLEIERDEIEVDSVTTLPPGGALEDGSGAAVSDVGYIYIREFTQLSTDQFVAAYNEVVDAGARGLILDLRNNLGGLLSTTVEIADEFLEGGVVLSERGRDGEETTFSARRGGVATEIPVVVLVNRFSASGSEVLAAALHENDRATLVGETTFGKGTVNFASELDDGGELYVTVARWFTPDGTLIEGVGISPDVEVIFSDADIDQGRDVQLHKAIDILRGTDTAQISTPAASPTPRATGTAEPAG